MRDISLARLFPPERVCSARLVTVRMAGSLVSYLYVPRPGTHGGGLARKKKKTGMRLPATYASEMAEYEFEYTQFYMYKYKLYPQVKGSCGESPTHVQIDITLHYFYCMKPLNIKAPKCTLFSRVKGRKGSTVLPRLIASVVGGSLLRRAHFESLRAAEAKNEATINHLMSKRQSVTLFSRVKGHKGSPVSPRLLPSIVMGSLLRRAHFESLRAAEA